MKGCLVMIVVVVSGFALFIGGLVLFLRYVDTEDDSRYSRQVQARVTNVKVLRGRQYMLTYRYEARGQWYEGTGKVYRQGPVDVDAWRAVAVCLNPADVAEHAPMGAWWADRCGLAHLGASGDRAKVVDGPVPAGM